MEKLLESIMLVLFGCSWPVSVVKSYRSKSNGGKSRFFLWLIWLGYVAGLVGRAVYNPSYVIIFYCINLLSISADIALYYRNRYYVNR
ncbi:hypothetical protein FACS18948_6310 [Clostridia bacterium]|nr:hypothetical protein FACS18948_6310 [Clostridia bacterium]